MDRWRHNIHAAELRLIALSPVTLMGAALTAAVAAPILWSSLDHALVLAWTAGFVSLTALRLVLWLRFRRIAQDDSTVIAWDRPLTLTIILSGAFWGLFGVSFYLIDDAEIRGVALLILASMLASGTIFYSAHLRAHHGYVLACALPIAAASFLHATTSSVLFGCVTFAYIALIIRAAHSFNRGVGRTIRLQFENAALVDGLKSAKESAENANRSKSQFLATMSHELRTPLNAVIGYSEILLEDAAGDGSGEERIADLRRIHTAGRHLLSLVNDVLDLAKIEAGRMEMMAAPVDLRGFLDEVVTTALPLVERNSNELQIRCAGDAGIIIGDATKLRQIILNLLSNSAKFTSKGRITLSVAREYYAGAEWISIAVADTGIGIEPEALGRLFTAFTQADASTSSKYGGTGLGLALSQRLARLMGGDITAESEPGHGSCFTLSLPTAPPGTATPRAEDRMIEKIGERVAETLGLPPKLQLS
ncbi:MAG: sensor histidine kinase [Stellaceae bacterium]